jgi:hypothetical protein
LSNTAVIRELPAGGVDAAKAVAADGSGGHTSSSAGWAGLAGDGVLAAGGPGAGRAGADWGATVAAFGVGAAPLGAADLGAAAFGAAVLGGADLGEDDLGAADLGAAGRGAADVLAGAFGSGVWALGRGLITFLGAALVCAGGEICSGGPCAKAADASATPTIPASSTLTTLALI